jgi:hypothetical protein
MNPRQRENASKYLYDISKGIILIAVVGNSVAEKLNVPALVIGVIGALALYLWAFLIERGEKSWTP